MVDGQTRRTLRRTRSTESATGQQTIGTVVSVQPVERTEPVIDRSAIDNDSEPVVERNGSQRIGVVEVNPEQLGEFIADRSASGDGDGGNGRTRRKRADAGTTRGGRKRKETPQNIEALVTMVHTWASVILKTPELMLDQSEVKQLSSAYETFSEHHEVPMLTAKRMSEINLIAVALSIYGTRFVAISRRRKTESKIHAVGGMPQTAHVNHQPIM